MTTVNLHGAGLPGFLDGDRYTMYENSTGAQALGMFSQVHATSLLIVCRAPAQRPDGKITIPVGPDHDGVEVWLLRHRPGRHSGQAEDRWREFLSLSPGQQEQASEAYELEGEVTVQYVAGYLASVGFDKLATCRNVPRTEVLTQHLQSDKEELLRRRQALEELGDQATDVEKFELSQVNMLLQRAEQMESAPPAPAVILEGEIWGDWHRRKPLFDVDLL